MIRDRERARRRRRLILGLASAPVLIAAAVVAVYFCTLTATTARAIGYYDQGSFAQSREQSSKLIDANLLERWLPYFNRGDAKAGNQDYTAAVDDFEKALELAPAAKKCEVRVNLAHTWETLGDIYEKGGYHQGAVQLYQAAKDVIAAAGNECPPDSAEGKQLQSLGDRVNDKQQQAQGQQDQQDQQDPQDSGSKLDDLGQKQQQGEQQKQNDDSRAQGSGPGGSTDKPW